MQQQAQQMPNWNPWGMDLNALFNPARCEVCGRPLNPTGTNWLNQWSEALYMPMMKEWSRLWGGMLEPLMQNMKGGAGPAAQPRHAAHGHGCCCSCCEPDDCHCRCCITNADLVVYARYGERRIVPITIENHLRREREIEVQLSDWTTYSGQPVKIEGLIVPPNTFTLKPCEERTIIITILVTGETAKSSNEQSGAASEQSAAASGEQAKNSSAEANLAGLDQRLERLPDVDECKVFYADLRIKGCDVRPKRIAVAVLPRDCDAHRIGCGCACCC